MSGRFETGDAVQTPFGKGVVREVRNGGRLLVDVNGRALVFKEQDVAALERPRRPSRSPERRDSESASTPKPPKGGKAAHASHRTPPEVDLHGLTVEEALARVDQALNDALLGDLTQLRFIHGRSGGRIRAALHKKLQEIAAVRHFLVDPRNEGITIVEL